MTQDQQKLRDLERQVAALSARVDHLNDRLAATENGFAGAIEPLMGLGLTLHEAQILALLMKRRVANVQAIYFALYGAYDDDDKPCLKIIHVLACRLRKKLLAFGVVIETRVNYGYHISEGHKSLISKILNQNVSARESAAMSGPAAARLVPAAAAGPSTNGRLS